MSCMYGLVYGLGAGIGVERSQKIPFKAGTVQYQAVDRETPNSEHRLLQAARSCTVVGNP